MEKKIRQRQISIDWLIERSIKHRLDGNKNGEQLCLEAIESHEKEIEKLKKHEYFKNKGKSE